MLEYKKTVKVPGDDNAAVNISLDDEKGHAVYLSHTGTLVVVEDDKTKNTRTKAAGFVPGADGCAGCDGC